MKAIDNTTLLQWKADAFQAIGHPIRLMIIEQLRGGELCVCDIVSRVDAQRSNVSRHLAVLLKAGVVTVRKEGLKMIYQLQTPCVLEFIDCVSSVVLQRAHNESAGLPRL